MSGRLNDSNVTECYCIDIMHEMALSSRQSVVSLVTKCNNRLYYII